MKWFMIFIAVCDKDVYFRKRLTKLINVYMTWKKTLWNEQFQINIYESVEQYWENENFQQVTDILFLGIEMHGMDGITFKNKLLHDKIKTKIIFVTNHTELVYKAFGPNVYAFLTKPLEKNKLYNYLDIIYKDIFYERTGKMLSEEDEKCSAIFWIKADGKYSSFKEADKILFSDCSLKDWEELLKSKDFFRIHKSYLINLEKILYVEESVLLRNGDRIPIARRKRKDFLDAYQKYYEKFKIYDFKK